MKTEHPTDYLLSQALEYWFDAGEMKMEKYNPYFLCMCNLKFASEGKRLKYK